MQTVDLVILRIDPLQVVIDARGDAEALAATDGAFAQIRDDMIGMQVLGVAASIDYVRVHPGLAHYMRERGVWNDEWDARIAAVVN
jgi:hypothetical protein